LIEDHVVYWIRHKNHTDIKSEGYVGVTNNFDRRMTVHDYSVRSGSEYLVHRAMRKYGDDILRTVIAKGDEEFCYFVESELRPVAEVAWNLAPGGLIPPLSGRGHSEASKLKMSKAHKGKQISEETRKRMSAASKGRPLSEESRNKIRQKATGRVKSEESKRKFALAMTGRNLWENSAARKDLWAVADLFYEKHLEHPKAAARSLAEMLGFLNCNPWKMKDKFKSGWIPKEDPAWLQFKEQYLTEQMHE
jgi:hypothetical protein